MIGRAGSKGYPRKNIINLNGRKLCEYPLIATKKSKLIDKTFVSTDCPIIRKISKKYKCELIDRPKQLSNSKSLGDHVLSMRILRQKKKINQKIICNFIICNAPLVTSEIIKAGIQKLDRNKKADSAVSCSIYNMWSPLRARKLDKNGFLKPFVPFETFGNPKTLNCDRDSQGNVYFADMSVSIVRPKCLEKLNSGLLPQRWMGKNILPILCEGGLDLDYKWQLPQLEYLLNNGKIKVEKFVKSQSFEHFKSFNNSEIKEIINKLVHLNSDLHNFELFRIIKKLLIEQFRFKNPRFQDTKEVFSLKSNTIAELQSLDRISI